MKVSRWNKVALNYPMEKHNSELTILLPMWNEALVIEKKLNDLIRDYPFPTSLLVIDSASDDNSVELVKQWLLDNNANFANTQLIEMPKRLGKTTAVKLAVEELNGQEYTGLVLMTDADALIEKGSIVRLHGWFGNETIGVVGASALRKTSLAGETKYRDLYELLRVRESKIDSTPFLEGSCMMWRHGVFNTVDLNTKSNADDAQISSLVRFGGLRSIWDNQSKFTDFAPNTIEGQRRQKIRRAQGLQRMLKHLHKKVELTKGGKFSSIFRYQRYFHLTIPLILLLCGIVAIFRWTYVGFTEMPVGEQAFIHAALGMAELLCLVTWLISRIGLKLPLIDNMGAVLTGFEYLLLARYHTFIGRSFHLWDQHKDTREKMARIKN